VVPSRRADDAHERKGVPRVAYVFSIDRTNCLNCGVCMDVCPVQALDMTRTSASTIEGAEAFLSGTVIAVGQPWMMEFPVQVAVCIGCELCATECPTEVITIAPTKGSAAFAGAQGPIHHAPEDTTGWVPLSAYTRESLKEQHTDPWGDLAGWRPARREASWQSWRTWISPGADRLMAPCQVACPVGTDAGLYVALVAEGRYAEALAVAADYNPFPSICGRICTAPCELACRRGVVDEPIAIRELKRFAADHGAEGYPKPPAPAERRSERVAIIGAGPTGLSAAYMLARAGYPVTVFEAMPVAGGMMAVGIPEYRLPKRVLRTEVERIASLGVEIRLNTALGRDVTIDGLKNDGYRAILLAAGASKSQPLGVPGEDAEGVWPATVFLKKVNLGEPAELAGDALVVGGGSTAMDAARSAWRAGARSVRVLYRRTREDMPAQADELRAAEHEGVIIDTLVAPVEIVRKNGWMTGVRCIHLKVTGRDADGRSAVAPVPGSEFMIDATSLLIAVGEAPDPSILPQGSSIQVAAWGGVVVDTENLVTAQAGIFAAGDVATGPRSVIEGVAQGQRAAWAIDRYLRGLPTDRYVAPWRTNPSVAATQAVRVDLMPGTRAEVALAHVSRSGANGSSEVSLGFEERTARAEAARCLRCDVVTECAAVDVIRRRFA
jgi:NADPH-dependent glutamate synthase beta subunit-like oxidoreductase/Pyruvate/2-oxoacid:ferredoxin oxidoreductase delta subunit